MFKGPHAPAAPATPRRPPLTLRPLQEAVRTQIDYYFSVGNLVRDVFLRSKMNGEGWIPLHVIGAFNRVRMLTPDPTVIVSAMQVRRSRGLVRGVQCELAGLCAAQL